MAGVRKPNPRIFQQALENWPEAQPDQVLMVGDNRHDLEMGRAAGAGGVIGVLTGTGTAETLALHADRIIESVAELPALLRN